MMSRWPAICTISSPVGLRSAKSGVNTMMCPQYRQTVASVGFGLVSSRTPVAPSSSSAQFRQGLAGTLDSILHSPPSVAARINATVTTRMTPTATSVGHGLSRLAAAIQSIADAAADGGMKLGTADDDV